MHSGIRQMQKAICQSHRRELSNMSEADEKEQGMNLVKKPISNSDALKKIIRWLDNSDLTNPAVQKMVLNCLEEVLKGLRRKFKITKRLIK